MSKIKAGILLVLFIVVASDVLSENYYDLPPLLLEKVEPKMIKDFIMEKDGCYSFQDQKIKKRNEGADFSVEEALKNGKEWIAKQYPDHTLEFRLNNLLSAKEGYSLMYIQKFRKLEVTHMPVFMTIGKYGVSEARVCYRKIVELSIPKSSSCSEEQAILLWEKYAKQKDKDYFLLVDRVDLKYYQIEDTNPWRFEPFFNITTHINNIVFRVNLYSCEIVTFEQKEGADLD